MDKDPTIHIKINDKRVEMTRQNSSVWQFAGHLAMYNHIFIVDGEDYGYFWGDKAKEGQYGKYVQFMVDHAYPLHINLSEVCETDVEAYRKYHIAVFPSAFEGLIKHE